LHPKQQKFGQPRQNGENFLAFGEIFVFVQKIRQFDATLVIVNFVIVKK
jgi:hypothetical protein